MSCKCPCGINKKTKRQYAIDFLALLHMLNRLEHKSSCGSEHSTRATSDLGSCTGELRWSGRVGRGGSDGSATGGLDGHGGIVRASGRGSGKAGAV
jgi:hypothetical protein